MKSARAWRALIAIGALVAPIAFSSPAAAATARVSAKVDGRAAAGSKESSPVRLPTRAALLDLEVANTGTAPIQVRTVRFSGSAMGLTFFAYETSVDIRVNAGATESRQFTLDLSALKGQASGLLPGKITVLDQDRKELGSQRLVVDVRGSVWSVYGFFGLALAVLTGTALTIALLALARHRLSRNRWSRGLRFLIPGLGLGATLVIGFSVMRIFAPTVSRWLPILAICAVGLFLLGYFSPTPDEGGPSDAAEPVDPRATLPARRPL